MTKKEGFSLVELMVVVAIIAILAAVAFPMYSTFKQKAKVSSALKACVGTGAILETWFNTHESFTGISVNDPTGGALAVGNLRVGVGLPAIKNVTWTITGGSTRVEIIFTFNGDGACPNAICSGKFCIVCDRDNDKCENGIAVGNGSLGMDHTLAITCTSP